MATNNFGTDLNVLPAEQRLKNLQNAAKQNDEKPMGNLLNLIHDEATKLEIKIMLNIFLFQF